MSRLIGSYPAGTLSCTGGVESTPGDGFKYHVFTSSGNFNITGEAEPSNPVGSLLLKSPTEIELEYLVVGGGGGGGGGGAGGLVYGTDNFLVGTKTITVGGGGPTTTASGTDSVFDTITALGGGRAGYNASPCLATGVAGGSGGAGGWYSGGRPGGAGLQPGSASGGFGNAGGTGAEGGGSGGGGGAGGIGQNYPTRTGGLGKEYAQFATIGGVNYGDPDAPGWFASGGSGYTTAATPFVAGPSGGGGDGSGSSGGGSNGAVNTGGGSGAGGGTGGTGGSGVVIIRYAV